MPVTRISESVDCSEKAGAGLWIEEVALAGTGPRSSIGSPMTLMMRPRVSGPTGTVMAAPVSRTSLPRTRPSVESMAMVRTTFSPRCCATSSTRRLPWLSVSSAFRIAGRSASNCTSTTGPMTWVMRPTAFLLSLIALVLACLSRSSKPGLAAAAYMASLADTISISSLVMIAWRVRL